MQAYLIKQAKKSGYENRLFLRPFFLWFHRIFIRKMYEYQISKIIKILNL